jgi:hypothetical protein
MNNQGNQRSFCRSPMVQTLKDGCQGFVKQTPKPSPALGYHGKQRIERVSNRGDVVVSERTRANVQRHVHRQCCTSPLFMRHSLLHCEVSADHTCEIIHASTNVPFQRDRMDNDHQTCCEVGGEFALSRTRNGVISCRCAQHAQIESLRSSRSTFKQTMQSPITPRRLESGTATVDQMMIPADPTREPASDAMCSLGNYPMRSRSAVPLPLEHPPQAR